LSSITLPSFASGMVFPQTVLKFHTMVGNTSPYVAGEAVGIRGILGGPYPWDLTRAVGELKSDGSLQIQIQGLIFLNIFKLNRNNFKMTVRRADFPENMISRLILIQ